jgi:hypothetical protein
MNMKKLSLHDWVPVMVPVPVPKIGSFYFCFSFHFYNLQMNSINVNDDFIINNIAKKNYYSYGKFDEKLVIADMKRIFVFIHDPYLFYVKTIVNSEIVICPRSPLEYIKEYNCWLVY